jgi:hypothetical protein
MDDEGNTYIITDGKIIKNGVEVTSEEGMEDFEEAMEDFGEEMEKLGEEILEDEGEWTIEVDTLPDSTSVTLGKWQIIVKENEDEDDVDVTFGRIDDDEDMEGVEEIEDREVEVFETKWFLFDIGYNTIVNENFEPDLPPAYNSMEDLHVWGSFDVNLHLFRSRINIANGYVNFNYGLSLEWHHFRFDQDFTILPNTDTLTLNTETIEYDKNKFNTTHIGLPLLLGFETKPWDTDKSFRVMVGYDPGLRIKGKTKHKLDGETDITVDDFNLSMFRHELNGIIGFGSFNIYASYDVNSMFNEGEGPDAHPLSIGLMLRKGF